MNSGAWVNPRGLSWAHPIERIKTLIYLSASDITGLTRAGEQYADRLARLIHKPKSRCAGRISVEAA